MYLFILVLPLLSTLTTGFLGRFIGIPGTIFISVGVMVISVLLSVFIFYETALCNSICTIKIMPWFNCESLNVEWGLLFDSLSSTMLIVVTVVSLLVHLFSTNYMSADPHLTRFMSYLTLFTFFMLVLVTADNLTQMFVGWEGVGLASYLLINFWYTRLQANKSAIKAIVVNRIGDFGLVLGIAAIFYTFKTTDYFVIFGLAHLFTEYTISFFSFEINAITFITLFLFIGAVGKSAQMGLHVWLPDAMEGPTPVSALIHAATMVTAGVFLLIRCAPLIEYSNNALILITIWGAITAFFAATSGLVQNDIKRIIAYSTCSQLGYMVFACGLSNYAVSFFHLMNHAFFKALLFLSAGAVIHALSDEQDIRKMGGLAKLLPFVYVMILIGSLSLMGFPFLTGFYSKDVILELAYSKYSISSTFAYWLGTISAFFTAFYSFRLIFLVFFTRTNAYKKYIMNVHESDNIVIIALSILCFGSIFIGYLARDLIIGLGTDFWINTLFYLPNNIIMLNAEFIPFYVKIVPVIFSLIGCFSAIYLYSFKINYLYFLFETPISLSRFFFHFLTKKWYFDAIYYNIITKPLLMFGYNITFKTIDRGVFELIGPLGLTRIVNKFMRLINGLQTGYIYHYIFFIVLNLTLFLFFMFSEILISSLNVKLLFIFIIIIAIQSSYLERKSKNNILKN